MDVERQCIDAIELGQHGASLIIPLSCASASCVRSWSDRKVLPFAGRPYGFSYCESSNGGEEAEHEFAFADEATFVELMSQVSSLSEDT